MSGLTSRGDWLGTDSNKGKRNGLTMVSKNHSTWFREKRFAGTHDWSGHASPRHSFVALGLPRKAQCPCWFEKYIVNSLQLAVFYRHFAYWSLAFLITDSNFLFQVFRIQNSKSKFNLQHGKRSAFSNSNPKFWCQFNMCTGFVQSA